MSKAGSCWMPEGEMLSCNDDYLSTTGDALSNMHVIVEGAIVIFENDTPPIIRLCTQSQEIEARTAINDIGSALYDLRRYIKHLQKAWHNACELATKEDFCDRKDS